MASPPLTPEQEKRAREAFDQRRFDPESYEKELCPELPPAAQVALAELELMRADPSLLRVQRDAKDAETLAAQREKNEDLAAEFAFLDPADYADEAARRGRVLKPAELLRMLQEGCGLTCWFALADAAMIEKQLNPRDVALAYRKIGNNPENLHNPERWSAAIAEIRQEEAGRQPMVNFERFGLWVVRGEPEYVTWIPGCWLREFTLVKFDQYGVPDWHIPGWRDVVLALVRGQFITEEKADAVFGKAVGPAARRYNMILAGLRNRRELAGDGEKVAVGMEAWSGGATSYCYSCNSIPVALDESGQCKDCGTVYVPTEDGEVEITGADGGAPEPVPCLECHHRHAHFVFCSQYDAWYKSLLGVNPEGAIS